MNEPFITYKPLFHVSESVIHIIHTITEMLCKTQMIGMDEFIPLYSESCGFISSLE